MSDEHKDYDESPALKRLRERVDSLSRMVQQIQDQIEVIRNVIEKRNERF